MQHSVDTWTIKQLIDAYQENRLDLSPPYQRKNIWSLNDQKLLIETVKKNWPMPNYFLLRKDVNKYEMVDGQQRSRTIIGYFKGLFPDGDGIAFDDSYKNDPDNGAKIDAFLKYKLSVTVIDRIDHGELIHEFYALINSAGLHLNRPEIMKAKYFESNFLKLATELASNNDLSSLKLFRQNTMDRMNDIDFVSELAALLVHGITDKKEKVDLLYEKDVDDALFNKIKCAFIEVIKVFKRFDSIATIRNTRYRQKNDFYSLFYFIHKNIAVLNNDQFDYCYRLLVKLAPQIRPSQEQCEPLMNYAINCVTQSNSKHARQERDNFLNSLLLNRDIKPNIIQHDILNYYGLTESDVKKLGDFTHIDIDLLIDIES